MLRAFSGYIVSSVLFVCVHLQEDDGRLIFVDVPYHSNSQTRDIYITQETPESPSYYQKWNRPDTSQVPFDDYSYRLSQDAYAIQRSQQNYHQQYQHQPQNAYSELQNSRGSQQRSEPYTSVITQVPTQSHSYQPPRTYTTRVPQVATKVYTYQSQVYTTRPPKTTQKNYMYQAQGSYQTRTPYTTSKSNYYQSPNTYTTTVTPQNYPYRSQNVQTVMTQRRKTNSYTLKPYTSRVPVSITKSSLSVPYDSYMGRPPKVPAKPVRFSTTTSPRPTTTTTTTTTPWVPSKTIIITRPPSVALQFQDNRTPPIAQTPVRPFQLVPSRSNQSPDSSRNRGATVTTDRNSVLPDLQFTTSRPGKIPPYSKEVSDKGTFEHLDCACPRNLNPVCASNGLTYPNDCVFKCALIKENPDLILQHKGSCYSTTTSVTTERDPSVLTFLD